MSISQNGAGLGKAIIVGIAMLCLPSLAAWVMTYGYGAITALVLLINGACLLIALSSPRLGLFVLCAQAMYTDHLKRMAVYYGAENMFTVVQVLIGPMLTLCAVNLGFLMDTLVFKKIKVDRMGWFLFIAPIVICAVLLIRIQAGLLSRVQFAANIALYITIIPMGYVYFKGYKDWEKFFRIQMLLAVPAALWGYWQYFYGFSQMEWEYAMSGLSPVHSRQMSLPNPRIFGLFGSESAYGMIAMYALFCFWIVWTRGRNWVVYLLCGVIFVVGTVLSQQRTAFLILFIVPCIYFFFTSRARTVAVYAAAIISFVLMVLNSDWLLQQGLDQGTEKLQKAAGENQWGQNVLRLSTFSARIYGWQRLKDPETWSLFGKKSRALGETAYQDDQTHDIISGIVINTGVIGLIVFSIAFYFFARAVHGVIWESKTMAQRKNAAWILSMLMPPILLSLAGGSNFSTVPFNLQIWSIAAALFVLRREIRGTQAVRSALPSTADHDAMTGGRIPQLAR
jgi:hypothetical protein